MNYIKVGIVGVGQWGKNYIRILRSHKQFQLVGVVEKNIKRVKWIKRYYPSIPVFSLSDLLSMVKAVVIVTPPSTHYSLVKKALVSGVHVLVEKPCTLSLRHIDNLTRFAEKKCVRLMTGFTLLYTSGIQYIKENLELGHTKIIEIDRGQTSLWNCSYKKYLVDKEALLEVEAKTNAVFDKKLSKEETWLR